MCKLMTAEQLTAQGKKIAEVCRVIGVATTPSVM
jgi:hypothetical protein